MATDPPAPTTSVPAASRRPVLVSIVHAYLMPVRSWLWIAKDTVCLELIASRPAADPPSSAGRVK